MANLPDYTFEQSGLSARPFESVEIGSKYDMTLYVREQEDRLHLKLSYAAELFRGERMEEMLRQYEQLLWQIESDPDRRIHEYSLLTPAAHELLPDPMSCLDDTFHGAIHELLAENARGKPHQLAVCDPQESWTYGELDARSNQLAHYLRAQGIEKGDRVAIYGHRSASLVWAVFGVLKAGAAFVILDPAYPAQRLIASLGVTDASGWLQIEAAGRLPRELEFVPGCGTVSLPAHGIGKEPHWRYPGVHEPGTLRCYGRSQRPGMHWIDVWLYRGAPRGWNVGTAPLLTSYRGWQRNLH